MKLKVLVTALMIGGAATACGRNAGMESGEVQPASGEALVHVENNYMLAMSVYAVDNNNVPFKLGTVGPGLTDNFTVSSAMLRQGLVRIYAQPTGGGRVVSSGALTLYPGNVVDMNIGPDLINSITTVK